MSNTTIKERVDYIQKQFDATRLEFVSSNELRSLLQEIIWAFQAINVELEKIKKS